MRGLLAAVLVVACTGHPAAEYTLRIAVSGPLEPVGPDPFARSFATIAQPSVFEPLARFGSDGVLLPVLAETLELAAPRAMRVWLRPEARFSDGSPLTFEDVVASLAQARLRAVRDGNAIRVESRDESLPIEILVSNALVFRKAGAGFLGTGPFVPVEQDPAHILLDRREKRPGFIQHILVIAYPKPQDSFAHTLRGDADLLLEVDTRWLEFFEGVPRLRIVRVPGTHAHAIGFNLARLSRDDRVALSRALRRDNLRHVAFADDCVPPKAGLEFEPLPSGRPLDLVAVPIFERFALATRRELGARGGKVEIVDIQTFFAKLNDFDLIAAKPTTWPPITALSNWHTGASTNPLHYSNPAVDAALDRRDWPAAQKALDEDPPIAIICTPPYVAVVDARIKAENMSLAAIPEWEVVQ